VSAPFGALARHYMLLIAENFVLFWTNGDVVSLNLEKIMFYKYTLSKCSNLTFFKLDFLKYHLIYRLKILHLVVIIKRQYRNDKIIHRDDGAHMYDFMTLHEIFKVF
jgi:hypothetical protein